MKKLLLSYVKLGSRREVSRSRSNVMALCSRTDMANSGETYAGCEVTKSCAVSNFVSADRIQVDRIGLRCNWIESRSNLVASANAPIVYNYFYISEATAKETSNSPKGPEQQSCQEGRCALVEGESPVCCRVPANQILLRVTGLNRTKRYSVTVSASNGAGEGEQSMPIFATCEFCGV